MSIEYLESLIEQAAAAGDGHDCGCDRTEQTYLAKLASEAGAKIIGEIGFNSGCSSYAFLSTGPDVLVYSFDLGQYNYTSLAKKHIDEAFPDRHKLICGDSLDTVPEFCKRNSQLKFDLIFIDGGHSYETARADLRNMRDLATRDTVLVMDDITPWKQWGVGPTLAWLEALRVSAVIEHELIKEGQVVDEIEPPGIRSWVVGKYNMDGPGGNPPSPRG